MSQEELESVVLDAGETIGEVALAIGMIVHALKRQPGFDVSNFDHQIENALPKISEKYTVTAQILESCLTVKKT